MGVATRGVKFKFSPGERVLCYEPDPTKAKVLYESKVLDLVAGRDDRGRKVPEYLIHFFGWNSSWDRCVREEFILPYTEENRELQTKLASDAALSIKGKRKSKLPPLIKETLNKKLCSESGNEKSDHQISPSSSSETDSSEDESDKEITLHIPDSLKMQLQEDWRHITQNNKLVKLPCQPNVINVLEGFVKHIAAKLLCASPPRNSKNGKQLMPDDVQNKLNLCKEAVDGIRIYFDFTLPHLLLYRQEKKQYYTDGTSCSPVSELSKDFSDSVSKLEKPLKVELESSESPSNKEILIIKTEPISPERSPKSLRTGLRSPVSKTPIKSEPVSSPEKGSGRLLKKATRGRPRSSTTRVLRSRDKQIVPTPVKNAPSPEIKPPSCRETSSETSPTREVRVTRKSTLQAPPAVPARPTERSASTHPVSGVQPLSNNCSSNSSNYSSMSNPQQYHLLHNAGLLQEINAWHIMSPVCDQTPAAPSLIYGPQHLLRLFVKLPDLISKMRISSRKLQPLQWILENFLLYMAEQKEQLFLPSSYIHSFDNAK